MITQYSYESTATRHLTDNDLDHILSDAVKFNSGLNITGFLLYNEGKFIQVLEGSKEHLRQVMDRIVKSSQHKDINNLYTLDVKEREFSDWAMGFKNSSDPKITEKFNELLNNTDDLLTLSMAKSLLVYVAKTT